MDLEVCDVIAVINRGVLVAHGPASDLRSKTGQEGQKDHQEGYLRERDDHKSIQFGPQSFQNRPPKGPNPPKPQECVGAGGMGMGMGAGAMAPKRSVFGPRGLSIQIRMTHTSQQYIYKCHG